MCYEKITGGSSQFLAGIKREKKFSDEIAFV
jgi:hypothetical protein